MKTTVTEMRIRRFFGDAAYSLSRWLASKSFDVRRPDGLNVSLASVFGEALYGFSRWIESESDQILVPSKIFSEAVSPELFTSADITACGFMPTIFLNPNDPEIREALIRGYSRATPDVKIDEGISVEFLTRPEMGPF